ncbi:substrate-binding domain-containing protein [Isoptericola cucumis]|uniref:D-ribose ABC transporter substrate-binding protein n=1 Tax=Isoptericola cucumis TaxID=1776856 RepID=A0ABQ2B9I6_9MICO|nr:substrate-binding domain-containing protein [Isoptericola cucumis]GGI09272.1 D-ribose ABC transporter substrate-binding protein [Isoptericola cucumis]
MLRNVSRTGRLTATVALGTTLALTLAACNRDSGGTDGEGGDGGAADGASVTLSLSTLNNPFFVDVRDGAQSAADELGIELEVVDAQNDSTAEANQVANSVTGGAEGLIINPVDSDAAGAGIGPAVQADLPVVAVDRAVNGAEVDSLVSSDNVAGGKQAADALAAAIGEKGEVIVLQGVAGTSASRDRGEGFAEGIAAYPDIEVVATQTANFDRAEALDVATNLLQSHPDAVGVFAENDEMALGAVQALGDRAGDDVAVVGFDGTDDALAAVQEGTMVATIAQQPVELGKQAVEVMSQVLAGESVDAEIPVPVETVTSDNVADFVK